MGTKSQEVLVHLVVPYSRPFEGSWVSGMLRCEVMKKKSALAVKLTKD